MDTSLIEIHSHVDQVNAKFSWSDWVGFGEFVPHILWRLPGRPYGALVFTNDSFDGLFWDDDVNNPHVIEKVKDDQVAMNSTGLSQKASSYYGE